MRSARVLLAVIGPRWLTLTNPAGHRRIDDTNDWIRRELAEAFAAGVRVIPILTEQVEIPAEADLPADIAALSRCQYRRLRHREPATDLGRIVSDLASLDPALAAAARSRDDAHRQLHFDVGRSDEPWALSLITPVRRRPVDDSYVVSLRDSVQHLVALDNTVGAEHLSTIAVRLLRHGNDLLETDTYQQGVKRDLVAAIAEVAELAGWLAFDANDQSASRRLNNEALTMTRLAGDRNLELLVLQNMSMQSAHVGRPREALLLASSALNMDRINPRLAAIFTVRKARAIAQIGGASDATDALRHARSLFAESHSRTPAWAWWFGSHEIDWHTGMCHADLGDWKAAIQSFSAAVDPAAPTSERDKYVYRSHLLRAQIEAGDFVGAQENVAEIAGYVGDIASIRTRRLLEHLVVRLERLPGGAAKQNVREHLSYLLMGTS